MAGHADCTSTVLSHGAPSRKAPDFTLPALWLRPGHRPGPRYQVSDGWEVLHVRSDLRHDHAGRSRAHSRDGHEPLDDRAKGFERNRSVATIQGARQASG